MTHGRKRQVRVTRMCVGSYIVWIGARMMTLEKVEGQWVLTDDKLMGEASTVMVGQTKAGVIEALEAEARAKEVA